MNLFTPEETAIIIILLMAAVAALVHCNIMLSNNDREFGEVSTDEVDAIQETLKNIRRKKTVGDIIDMLALNGVYAEYEKSEDMFYLYEVVVHDKPGEKPGGETITTDILLGCFHFKTYQDAVDWIRGDKDEQDIR